MSTSYLTHQEATAILALATGSADQRRVAFAGLSEADKTACCGLATRDIDGCVWRGRVLDTAQTLMWPRYASPGDRAEMFAADAGPLPSGITAWSVAGLPHGLRESVAVQAGVHALRLTGGDYTAHLRELARRGVVSSAGGETIDLLHALSPWARLCDDAQGWMEQFRRCSA